MPRRESQTSLTRLAAIGHAAHAAIAFVLSLFLGLLILVNTGSFDARAQPSMEAATSPFHLKTEPITSGNALEQWRRVQAEIVEERKILERCRTTGPCPAPARLLLNLIKQGDQAKGRAKIGRINRAVNFAIYPMSDLQQWGVPDRWSSPFETLRVGRGDCEDYAIVKYVALLEAGIPADAVKLVIVRNEQPNEDHAAVAARLGDQWLILDERRLAMVRDVDLAQATPQLELDEHGARRFVPRPEN
jgi:predicted transglutaminase-like cysteine proteinase